MAALQARFTASLAPLAEEIEASLMRRDLQAVRETAHSLAGRSGMFGFVELGEIARQVDEAEDCALPELAEALVAALRRAGQED